MQVAAYKVYDNAQLPSTGTAHSACWDLSACLVEGARIDVITSYNEVMTRVVQEGKVSLFSGERALIPTGLIFDIPQGYSLRIHPRSGLSYKKGIALSNCEGVIDSDYVEQTFVSIINHSELTFTLSHGDRIAQVEIVRVEPLMFVATEVAPERKTNRAGGFGSTGLNT